MKNYNIKLNLRDLEILEDNLKDSSLTEKLTSLIENYGESAKQATFNFDECEIDKMIDCLTNLLCLKGLEENYEPNTFGLYIEGLIDKFSVE